MSQSIYDKNFYEQQWVSSLESAKIILPIVLSVLPKINSVADFGCGTGVWLSVLKDLGVNDIMGYDGAWVKEETLKIPIDKFEAVELDKKVSIRKKYDLAISVEVAEHLPEKSARTFVETLVKSSDIVLFSAAIPLQGGTNHINEQWQDYWHNIFNEFGFIGTDYIRKKIWNIQDVEIVYRQNIVLYVKCGIECEIKNFYNEEIIWNVVHPEFFIERDKYINLYTVSLFVLYKIGIKRTIKKIVGKKIYECIKKMFGRKNG